jgi:hypothetical protein
MKIGPQLLALLHKTYVESTVVEMKFGRYDLAFKTDELGRPVLLFMGKKDPSGMIRGERFARRIVKGADGALIKDHWDNKGKI